MFFPTGDAPNEAPTRPWVNYGLIAANVLVYFGALLATGEDGGYSMWVHAWGFVPLEPRIETFFTSMFMHAGFVHLAGNMLFLFIFGDNVEGRLGHLGYLFMYLASGLAAVLLFWALAPGASVPLVGASGAIFGVEGFYFLAFPRNRVRVMIWILIIWWTWIPARLFLGFYFVLNLFYMLSSHGEALGGGVAYAAHVGGFVFGLALAFALRATRPPAAAVGRRGRSRRRSTNAPKLLESAHAALEQGHLARAESLFVRILQEQVFTPEAPEAALHLGLLRSRVLGRPEAARTALTFAARMHPVPEQRALAVAELERLL